MKLGRVFSGALRVAFGFVLAGCGSDDGPGPTSGLDGRKQLSALSAGEIGSFCDWAAAKYGGYGKHINCGMEHSFYVWTDQSACTTSFSPTFADCVDGTVAQEEACISQTTASPCLGASSAECRTLYEACRP